ncbi:MAG TPA: c-type cytochrome domain-containing protein [Chitinophagaceae bacterium]|nr:c-type cytochrome domain-containing protein [Chitinophagaceae bacterium]
MLLTITEFIGRFHPVLVHLPIGFLLIGLLLQWLSVKKEYHISKQAIKLVILCGMIAAIISCITGYLLSLSGDYNESIKDWHMWMGIAVAVVSILMYAKISYHKYGIQYKILSFVLFLLILITGHLGGTLTHGANYLTEGWTNTVDSITPKKAIPNIEEANIYSDVVQPILQSKCYSCHGEKKQKSDLRLDAPQWIIKGSKNGPVINGKEGESELINRISLPREDEDHMPPKQKPQLNEQEIALIHWWIDQGASFTKKIKELKQPETLKPYLLSLQSDHADKKVISNIPESEVEKGSEKAMQLLKDKGITIIPVAQNSNYLMADYVSATNVTDQDIELLLPLKKQLVWLKLGNTNITDSALSLVGQCTNLTLLQLNNTKVTDKGLAALDKLDNLQSINLVGTRVTAQGVLQLQSLKSLQSIYLYQTKVNKADWQQLKRAFSKASLDTGGYIVPLLVTDTTEVKPPKPVK